MLLGGLWHGASWNFLIWGGYHGGLLALERAFRIRTLTVPVTFCLALIGWVFFRAADLPQSLQVLRQMFGGAPGRMLLEPWHLGLAALALLLAILEEKKEWFESLVDAPAWVYATALALMFFCVEIFGVIDASIPFIYFQF
jgi:D-alanyl-lipoteichoic acid acyltransferase DltB (MBOAT superfamily)